jgi:hypothetical protein
MALQSQRNDGGCKTMPSTARIMGITFVRRRYVDDCKGGAPIDLPRPKEPARTTRICADPLPPGLPC